MLLKYMFSDTWTGSGAVFRLLISDNPKTGLVKDQVFRRFRIWSVRYSNPHYILTTLFWIFHSGTCSLCNMQICMQKACTNWAECTNEHLFCMFSYLGLILPTKKSSKFPEFGPNFQFSRSSTGFLFFFLS